MKVGYRPVLLVSIKTTELDNLSSWRSWRESEGPGPVGESE